MGESAVQERLIAEFGEILARYGRRFVVIPVERLHAGTKAQRVAQWRALQRRGVAVGLPDVIVPGSTPCGRYGGIAIELKRDAKVAYQPGQREWLAYFVSIGWRAERANSLQEARHILIDCGYLP